MTDEGFQKVVSYILRNKKLVGTLLDRFDANDIERGILSIHQDMINKDIKMLIMDKYSDYINDYHIIFDHQAIFVDLDLTIKQLGRIKAKYMLSIEEFEFSDHTHRIKLSYKEDLKSEGNFMQSMAIKAAGLKGNYLQTAVEMSKLDFLIADIETLTINLDRIDTKNKIPPTLTINYISSENEILKLHFDIDF